MPEQWLADLPPLSEMTVPKSLKSSDTSYSPVTQLHHFSDASQTAYGAVSYISRDNKCCLVMSKAKLAPTKPSSISHLELLAAVVATELEQHMRRHLEIPIDETFFWSDSTIVLQYINNKDRRFQTFVANRVAKIHERSETKQWKHVDSASNPADDVSRGMTSSELSSSERWLHGPSYLQLTEEEWLTSPDLPDLPDMQK